MRKADQSAWVLMTPVFRYSKARGATALKIRSRLSRATPGETGSMKRPTDGGGDWRGLEASVEKARQELNVQRVLMG